MADALHPQTPVITALPPTYNVKSFGKGLGSPSPDAG